jgi:hypothetical protein
MKSGQWKTYRTRFLVKAKQLNSSLSFIDPLGRQHSGRKGDYLVESSDGVISIAPRQIFEDIYVAMMFDGQSLDAQSLDTKTSEADSLPGDLAPARRPVQNARPEPFSGRRKLPQPCRERRGSPPSLGFM